VYLAGELRDACAYRAFAYRLIEQNDEWAVKRQRYISLENMAHLSDDPNIMLSAVPSA
jgi:hypothetical protein